jgi:dipeptidyl aminopeptidase/acylaminoacyl peptidase
MAANTPRTGNRIAASIAAAFALAALASCSTSGTKVGLSRHKPSAGRNGPIAYQRFAGERDDGRTSQIYLRRPDGTEVRLTHIQGGAFSPAWSFDGSRIAFESGSTGRRHEIFTMSDDGSGLRQVTRGCAATADCESDVSPAWSPDGRRISFLRLHGPLVNRSQVHEEILVAARVDLMVVGADGRGERALKRWSADPQPPPGRSSFGWTDPGAPVWSPDGKQIAVALGTMRHPNKHAVFNTALHVIEVAGGGQRQITPWIIGAGNPSWSRDGRHIAFNSWGGHSPNLYVVDPDGRDLRLVLRGATISSHIGWVDAPVWSPDGTQIAFGTQTLPCRSFRVHGCPRDPDLEPFDLYAIGANGAGLRRLTSAPQFESHPAWGPAQ